MKKKSQGEAERGLRAPVVFEQALFGYDFHGADGGIVGGRREIDLEFALSGRLKVGKGFYQGSGACLFENIKSLQEHVSITPDIKYPAARASNSASLNAEPVLHKIEL